MRSQKEVRFGIPLFARMTGRSRHHLSLREKAQNSPPGAALKEGRRTYEMAVVPVGKNPLSPRLGGFQIGPRRQGSASPLRALDGSGPI